jgi:hypothetical protein
VASEAFTYSRIKTHARLRVFLTNSSDEDLQGALDRALLSEDGIDLISLGIVLKL